MTESRNQSRPNSNTPTSGASQMRYVKLAVTAVFIAACALSIFMSFVEASASQAGAEKKGEAGKQERFDYLVRGDFFAGFAGDQKSLDRAMKLCEDTLAKNPKHAEAMVWHGAGLLFTAGQHFQKQDYQRGGKLWQQALEEMGEAVRLEPTNVGVLIPRGAVMLAASQFAPPAQAKQLLETGLGDYERVAELQKSYFSELSCHGRGELLFGLAEGWLRAGNTEKARAYFNRLAADCSGSPRQKQAATFLEKGTLPAGAQSCTGCHTK